MPDGKKIFQTQLKYSSNYKKEYKFKFHDYPKEGIMHEIRKYFKAKHYYQNKARNNFENTSRQSIIIKIKQETIYQLALHPIILF